MKSTKLLGAFAASLLLSACATVTRGPNVKFHIVTDPPGAEVTTDLPRKKFKEGESIFHGCAPSPCHIHVSRRSEFVTTVSMPGYHTATVEITSGFGNGGSAVGASGAIIVAGSVYSSVYALASFVPALFGTSANAGAAAGATQAATGIGVVMLGIDIASGAMLNVRPNPLVLFLVPEDQPLPENTYIDSPEEFEAFLESTGRELQSEASEAEDEADPAT